MEFRLLGPVVAEVGGRSIPLGRRRERALLAALLLDAGRVVPVARLIELIWDDEPPPEARKTLRVHVSRLRRCLEPAGDAVRLASSAGGYVLSVDRDLVDVHRFDALVATARDLADPAERGRVLREALAIWRGPALADLASARLARNVGVRLEESRLAALEQRITADLADGRHEELLGELAELTEAHPARERLVAARMLALYRAGRRRDALAVYDTTARALAAELGLDPGPELRELHTSILRDDPELAPPPDVRPYVVRPAQLPADLSTFAGRDADLAELLALCRGRSGPVAIVSVDGMAGVGKTALVVHAAHRLVADYPDGQLFLDLHGFAEGIDPVGVPEALARLLRFLGVTDDRMPAAVEDRAALYRSVLADRRVLIVLDNAAGEAQVRPLLPGMPGCLALITSRRQLSGLDTARPLSLDVLPAADAATLFASVAGPDRTAGEPAELVGTVVDLCGRLPLAVRLAAARLRARRAWSLAHLVSRLRDEGHRLAELSGGERGVTTAIDLSYRELTAGQRRLFRLLGLHNGPDIDVPAAAALADLAADDAERMLDELLDVNLLLQHEPGRYRLHDLIRTRAGQICRQEEPEPERITAAEKLLGYYARTAAAAAGLIAPYAEPPASGESFSDKRFAAAWLDAELANLLASVTLAKEYHRHAHVVHLSARLDHYLFTTARYDIAETLHTDAVAAAQTLGDRSGEVTALNELAKVRALVGAYGPATECFGRALDVAQRFADRGGELQALRGIGNSEHRLGRLEPADERYRAALRIAREIGDRQGELDVLRGMGDIRRMRGEHEPAVECFEQALRLARAVGDQRGELDALHGLGNVHITWQHHASAVECLAAALRLAAATADRRGELQVLNGLGGAHLGLDQHGEATDYFQRALDLARDVGNRNQEFEALLGLGHTRVGAGHPAEALRHHADALAVATELGQADDQARAHHGLATAHDALGAREHAHEHWRQALDIIDRLGLSGLEEVSSEEIHARL